MAQGQGPIKIGEINSYRLQSAFVEPHKRGMELAIEEINSAGGVLGRKLELHTRDDNSNPADGVRVADELVSREKVDVLTGVMLSHVALGVSNFASQKKVFYLASEALTDKLIWDNGHKYTYRLRSSTYTLAAMLVPPASALKRKRWAIVYPNYEYGQASAAAFKKLLKAAQPDVEFVAEQAVPLGRIDAAATTQALLDAKPDAIFSTIWAGDLLKFLREGRTRGLLNKDMKVVSMLIGEPEYLDPLRDEAPEGWIVTGYPWQEDKRPGNVKFVDAYQKRFKEAPRLGSVVGYSAIYSLAAGIKKAGSTNADALSDAFAGLQVGTPFGDVQYRAIDHQSTMGTHVGTVAVRDGKGVLVDWKYLDGKDFLPSDVEVRKLRPND
ncbi:ABC transporter substrate-binding protein [Variovorax saccharolyticus]|uniref:ABC transporter substrate-binding protein n=1 Tax=Variovorax saccharolyticus TaxID=3053516 RepID=UPI002578B707|nr:ABC transporter substrate-binding protein [Variovorax sp. J22R187]MDM0021867.1 ABC transporter substrate-binding protein [Variovorax sp. J22R187]